MHLLTQNLSTFSAVQPRFFLQFRKSIYSCTFCVIDFHTEKRHQANETVGPELLNLTCFSLTDLQIDSSGSSAVFARWRISTNSPRIFSSVSGVCYHLLITSCSIVHITPALTSLHWLHVPERISFKLAGMTYRSVYGTSPSYLQSCFTRVADMTSRRRLRSSTSHRLDVPPVRLSTVDKRAFPVSGATIWNDLPL